MTVHVADVGILTVRRFVPRIVDVGILHRRLEWVSRGRGNSPRSPTSRPELQHPIDTFLAVPCCLFLVGGEKKKENGGNHDVD